MVFVKKEEESGFPAPPKFSSFDNSAILPVTFYKNSTFNNQGLLILQPKMATTNVETITSFLKAILSHPDDLIGDEYIYGYPDILMTDWGIIKSYLNERGEPATISEASKVNYPVWCQRAHESYLFCLVRRGNEKSQWPEFVLLWKELINKALNEYKRLSKSNSPDSANQCGSIMQQRLRTVPKHYNIENEDVDHSVKPKNLFASDKQIEQSISPLPLHNSPEAEQKYHNGILVLRPVQITDKDTLLYYAYIVKKLQSFNHNVLGPLFIKGFPNLGSVNKLFVEYCNIENRDFKIVKLLRQIHELYWHYKTVKQKGRTLFCLVGWEQLLELSKTQLGQMSEVIAPVFTYGTHSFNNEGFLILPPKYISSKMIDSSKLFVQLLSEYEHCGFVLERLVFKHQSKPDFKYGAQYIQFRQMLLSHKVFGSSIIEIIVANTIIYRIHAEYLCFKFTLPHNKFIWPDYIVKWDSILNETNVAENRLSNNYENTSSFISKSSEIESKFLETKKGSFMSLKNQPGLEHSVDIEEMKEKALFFMKFKSKSENGKVFYKRSNEYDSNGLLILKPLLKRIPGNANAKTNLCMALKDYPVNLVGFKFILGYPDIGLKTFGDFTKHVNDFNTKFSSGHPLTVESLKDFTETIHKVFLYYIYNFADNLDQWPLPVIIWGDIIQRSFIEIKLLDKFLTSENNAAGLSFNSDNYLILEPELMDEKYSTELYLIFLRCLADYGINLAQKKYTLSNETVTYGDWLNFQKFTRIKSQESFFYKQFNAKESEDMCDKIHKEFLYYKALQSSGEKYNWPQYLQIWDSLLTKNSDIKTIFKSPRREKNFSKTSSLTVLSDNQFNSYGAKIDSTVLSNKKSNKQLTFKESRLLMKDKKKLKKEVKLMKFVVKDMKKKHQLDILGIEKMIEANYLLFRTKIQSKDKELLYLKEKVDALEKKQ
ncbi:hypothetical protein QEN19_001098 [Hanseniaspora menglaensis]